MLEGRHLSVAFDSRPVLDDISLAVAPGERVQLAAPSGTGKTTLCRVLAGYLAPRAGEVLVDGEPLPKRGPCPVQLIGQHPELTLDPRMRMAASLAECGASEEELDRLRELLGIRGAWLSRYPHEPLRRRAAALLHRPGPRRAPELPHRRRGLHHAGRRDPGADLAGARRRGRGARHGPHLRLPFPGLGLPPRHPRGGVASRSGCRPWIVRGWALAFPALKP